MHPDHNDEMIGTMAGRKQFDEDRALEAAMTVFWQKGYEATSLADLEAATGLSKSSLYNAYHSKDALFARCLERFHRQHGGSLRDRLDHPHFVTAIGNFFEGLLQRFEDASVPEGCLATMAAMEVGTSDCPAADLLLAALDRQRGDFERRCARAVEDGELDPGIDTQAVAAMLLSMTRGIAVLNRGQGNAELARKAVQGMLGALARCRTGDGVPGDRPRRLDA